MNSLQIDVNNLHHAYVLAGGREVVVQIIENFLAEALKYPIHGNPDYVKEVFESFGVDDGHRIAVAHLKRAITGNKKIFLISVLSFSHEAQNALLKMFEEPTENTHFFIIVPSLDILLPTLKSRLLTIEIEEEKKTDTSQAQLFFSSPIATRMKMVDSLLEEKNKHEALLFLSVLESYAHVTFLKNNSDFILREFLEDVVKIRGYLRDRSPSVKILLEHVVHTAPHISP
jgi:hypothetical protein